MTLYYSHPECLEHQMQPGHPESPARLVAIADALRAGGELAQMDVREAPEVDDTSLLLGHRADYLAFLRAAGQRASGPPPALVRVDPDTALGPRSLAAARRAAGAGVAATRAILRGEDTRAFCAVRPPGHHAEEGAAMGFCVYNNIALAALTALAHPGIERVAVLDFDVHHGNGTVDLFAERPEVLVCSSFQHPFYPGRLDDLVRPNIVNTPLSEGTDGTAFRRAIEATWAGAVAAHRPQVIFVSAGFDAHQDDPIGGLRLREDDFAWITRLICDWADSYAEGRIVSMLEGGYDLRALARSVVAHVDVLLA